jgi:hypothetical protein
MREQPTEDPNRHEGARVHHEAAHENGRVVERMARQDHPQSDLGGNFTSHENGCSPSHPAHVWILVLLVTLAGVFLSWWGITFN